MWVIALLAFALVALAGYGNARWNAGTTQLLSWLDASQTQAVPQFFNAKELDGLPVPVKRYFETVLKAGQPIITGATVQHSGSFNMGVAARIHDAYVAGSGMLKVAIFGLIPVADLPASADLSRGELMRFMAEATWYPTALLPSQGVVWQGIDAQSAMATLTDGDVTLSMRIGFAANGLIDTVRAESRGRLVGKTMTYLPWQGHFWNYAQKSGMLVPLEAEVAWMLPGGPRPYYRSRMTSVTYDFASLPHANANSNANPTP